jgi:outer membrane immunogenic protein
MKAHLLATVSTLALAGAASAADLPTAYPTKAPPAVAAPSWVGAYAGLLGGAAWLRTEFIERIDTDVFGTGTADEAGLTLGGQVGYNWQLQNFVYGIEADWNWVDAKASGTTSVFDPNLPYSAKLSWLATIRGRLGVLVSPPTLLYATGGYAAGRVEHNSADMGGFAETTTRSGWAVGGGIEHMVAPKWTVKAEALYVDLGKSTVPGAFASGYFASFRDTAVIARVGANFKF